MRSGRLRHRGAIYSIYKANGVSGAETLTKFADIWFGLDWLSGKEIQVLGGTYSQLTGRVTMRYINGVRSDMILIYNGRRFKFVSPPINTEENNREIQLVITESK